MERSTRLTLRRLSGAAAAATALGATTPPAVSPLHAQGSVDLTIAATTDVHGRIRGWDYYANTADPARSLAGAATIVDSVRTARPGRVVLVDAGDLLQGNPLTYVVARVTPQPVHPVVAAMNVMRYDAAAIGNHEFNYGVPFLQRAMGQAAFPFLAANVEGERGTRFAAPYTVVERAGVRVGIVGATTPGSNVWDRENLRAAGLTVTDIVPAVRRAVAEVRRRADVVVVVLHSGLGEPASYDTVTTGLPSENVAARVPREIPGIDVVVFGHSHREVVDSTINGVLVVQPRNWSASVALATLTLERRRGRGARWQVVAKRGESVRVAGHRESPEVLAASTGSHRATIAWATAPVGRATVAWRADSARVADTPIIDFINETMRRETGADLAATAAFSLDASLDTGAITLAALSRLYPYDNTLRSVRISGATLKAFLEHSSRYYRTMESGRVPVGGIVDTTVPGFNFDIVSGADYTIDLTRPVGSRVTGLSVKGRPVSATDTFTMALNNYRQGGGGGFAMLAGAPVVYQKDTDIRALLIEEVRRRGTLDPSVYFARNWRLEPAAAVAAAFAEQRRGRAVEATGGRGGAPVPAGAAPGALAPGALAPGALAPPAGPVTSPTLRVIAMSDFHAALRNRPDASGRITGGAVPLSAALRRAQAECTGACVSVIVDAGDMFSGSPASDWAAGRPTVDVMNRLDVAAGALGNHEFDFGQDTLRMRLADLRHAVLAANVRGPDGRIPSFARADTIVTRGGVRIGIVGAAGTHTSSSTKRRNVRTLTFLDPVPVIAERTAALRRAGARMVIGVIHDGARCERDRPTVCSGEGLDVARRLAARPAAERPDVFVMGHAHVNLALRIGGMPVVEPASSGRGIAVVDVPLVPVTGAPPAAAPASGVSRDAGSVTSALADTTGGVRAFIRFVPGDSTREAHPALDSVVETSIARVRSRLERPVATIAEAMPRRGPQYALGNLIADAQRASGNAFFSIMNNGGIRTDVQPGPINYGGVHEIHPFGNVMVRVRVRGRELAGILESVVSGSAPDAHVSGMLVDYDPSRPAGSRIVRVVTAEGAPIDPNRIYTMIINDFMLDDGDGFSTRRIVSSEVMNVRDIDALAAYLGRQPQPVRASPAPRIRSVQAGSGR